MRHQVHGKKLNRSVGHRKALYRNLTQSLVEHERITTTLVKAKAVRPVVEKLITRAKQQDLPARRAVLAYLPTEEAARKLYEELGPRFTNRPGGYTRIIKAGRRVGDGAEMAVIEFVELGKPEVKGKKAEGGKRKAEAKSRKEGGRQKAEKPATRNPQPATRSEEEAA